MSVAQGAAKRAAAADWLRRRLGGNASGSGRVAANFGMKDAIDLHL